VTLDASHACVIDLDGVVWLDGSALPGAVEGVELLRREGVPVLFATNNASPALGELLDRLAAIGLSASRDEIATSALAAASLLAAGTRSYVLGGEGLREAAGSRGLVLTEDEAAAVLVGLTVDFDYQRLDRAAAFVRSGARFIATNTDPTLPVRGGQRPGAGAIVAAVSTAAGRAPEVAGKPHAAMCDLVRSRGAVGAVVGDRASTDGAFAVALGVPFAHVRSGMEAPPSDAAVCAGSLLEAVTALLG